MTENKKTRRSKVWIFPLAAGVLAAAAAGSMFWEQQISAQALAVHDAEIRELNEQIALASLEQEEARRAGAALVAGAPGSEIDAVLERMDRDEVVIGELLETLFTWKSHAEYVDARRALQRDYSIGDDSNLLTTLMPEAPVNVDGEGKEYPYIDAAGLNSSLDSFTLKPLGVRGADYSYLVQASVNASSTDGSTEASRPSVLMVTISADEGMTSVSGWAAPREVRVSG